MKILVTGGAGFIGSHIVQALLARGDEVVVLDSLRTGHRENVPAAATFLEGDVRDDACVREACDGVEIVFHLAAAISVPESMSRPVEYTEINVTGTLNVLQCARASGARRLVFSSSAAVYGDAPGLPKTEGMMPCPQSPYAVNKLDGEFHCGIYSDDDFSCVALRYFNVFGPRQDVDSPYAAAIPVFLCRALRGEPLTVFGDGSQTRDFVYVADVVAANLHAATCPAGVYNVGTGTRTGIGPLAEEIAQMVSPTVTVAYGEPRPGDILHSRASIEMLTATGWRPRADFGEALHATRKYYQGKGVGER